ncbi:MAG: GGDEF domain-containing protein [Acidobacteriota bacterium]|nr:GGDEF domain-containing protein [Acidobacteriota bacterium]
MGRFVNIAAFRERLRNLAPIALWLAAGAGVLAMAWWLRDLPAPRQSLFYTQLRFADGLLALIFAAAAFARFRGNRQRLSLVLAGAFALNGIILMSLNLLPGSSAVTGPSFPLPDSTTTVFSRTLLALLLLAPVLIERSLATSRHPNREIAIALTLVVLATAALSFIHNQLPADLMIRPEGIFSRPGNLFPAALFLAAAVGYRLRLRGNFSLFDRSLCFGAALYFASCLAASQSMADFDAPFRLAAILQFAGYATLLGAALFDNVQLFGQIRDLAATDPLTGLANYRRLMEALDAELQRSDRTGRPFSVALFDLDGLKAINDRYGHLTGSRAICRVANVLRANSRTIDVPSRYGGDEFAAMLPETGPVEAEEFLRRVCDCVSQDAEFPPIAVSAGLASFPLDGRATDALLAAADGSLYDAKRQSQTNSRVAGARAK